MSIEGHADASRDLWFPPDVILHNHTNHNEVMLCTGQPG